MKVYTVSDVHVDYPENMDWVLSLNSTAYLGDILVLAGDVSHNLEDLARVDEGGAVLRHPVSQGLDFRHDPDHLPADAIGQGKDRGGEGKNADVRTRQAAIPHQGRSQDGNRGEGYSGRPPGDEAKELARPRGRAQPESACPVARSDYPCSPSISPPRSGPPCCRGRRWGSDAGAAGARSVACRRGW